MSDTQSKESQVQFESSGVYVGTLIEDMSATVKRTGLFAIDVEVSRFWTEDVAHPLTKVYADKVLPLFKGDQVLVKFTNSDLLYPYLFFNPKEQKMPAYAAPEAKAPVQVPDLSDEDKHPLSAEIFSDDHFVLHCDGFSVVQYGASQILVSKDGIVISSDKPVGIQTSGEIDVSAKTIKMKADTFNVNDNLEVK